MTTERLDVRQILEQVQAAKPTGLPDALLQRLIHVLEREAPDRVEDVKALLREFARD